MRTLRFSKRASQRVRSSWAFTFARALRFSCCSASSLAAASEARDSISFRVRNSCSSCVSRAANSCTVHFSRSSSDRVSDTLGSLFTIFSDFAQQLIQLFNHCDRFIHAGKQIVHEAVLKLLAFAI